MLWYKNFFENYEVLFTFLFLRLNSYSNIQLHMPVCMNIGLHVNVTS